MQLERLGPIVLVVAKNRIFIVRRPLPAQVQGPASNGTVGVGASSSRLNSRIDSKM